MDIPAKKRADHTAARRWPSETRPVHLVDRVRRRCANADRRALPPRPAAPARRVTVVFAPRVSGADAAPTPAPEAAPMPC